MKISNQMGLLGLYLFSISAWAYNPGVDVGLILMLLATFINPKFYRVLWNHWLIRFSLILFVFLIISAVLASIEFPSSISPQSTALYRWSKLLLFFLPAWWMSQDEKAMSYVFGLSLLGLLLMISFNMDWGDFLYFKMKERNGFGLADPNETAMACGIYILALPLFCFRFQVSTLDLRLVFKVCAFILILTLLVYVFLLTLSRQAWLALAIAGPLTVFMHYYHLFKAGVKDLKILFVLLSSVFILSYLVYDHRDFILSRVHAEKIESNASIDQNNPSSIGIRLNMLHFGLEHWLKRPLLGWGIGSSGTVIKQSHDPRLWIGDENLGNHGFYLHLHDVYVEMLLRFGLIGVLGWLVIFIALLHILWDAYRSKDISNDLFLFLSGLALMMLIIGFFGFYVGNNRGCAYWLLLAGSIYSFRLKRALHV